MSSTSPETRWQRLTANYPTWAQELARKYFTKTITQFILHGNVRDLIPSYHDQQPTYRPLEAFLVEELFASRDLVVLYDRSSGIHFADRSSRKDFYEAVSGYDGLHGTELNEQLPKDPFRAFTLLANYFRTRLNEGKRIACVIDHAETVVPMAEASLYGSEDRNVLVALQKWARTPLFIESDFTLCLVTENLRDLNQQLVRNPYTNPIHLPLPDKEQRLTFIKKTIGATQFKEVSEISPPTLAQQTAGMNLVQLRTLLADLLENQAYLTVERLSQRKKEVIESEAYGLLEFVEPDLSLEAVAGHHAAKNLLQKASKALRDGHQRVLPMGYLVCGPVGVGKTFLITCFAGDIGIPMVKLKNFRSQWQGVTEGNLEKILHLLEAITPVAVMIDEADAMLGNRASRGDSGVSNRVFAQIASFMSRPENRGRILWFLVTARPDLMPVDLKRQGRAEEHLALFYPSSRSERKELVAAMLKHTGIDLSISDVPELLLDGTHTLSGADLEALFTRVRFEAQTQNGATDVDSPSVTPQLLEQVVNNFIPPAYPEEIELQTFAAMVECTRRELLPIRYQNMERKTLVQQFNRLRTEARLP